MQHDAKTLKLNEAPWISYWFRNIRQCMWKFDWRWIILEKNSKENVSSAIDYQLLMTMNKLNAIIFTWISVVWSWKHRFTSAARSNKLSFYLALLHTKLSPLLNAICIQHHEILLCKCAPLYLFCVVAQIDLMFHENAQKWILCIVQSSGKHLSLAKCAESFAIFPGFCFFLDYLCIWHNFNWYIFLIFQLR